MYLYFDTYVIEMNYSFKVKMIISFRQLRRLDLNNAQFLATMEFMIILR